MYRIDTYSPATRNASSSDLLHNDDAIERELSNKIRQFMRTVKNRATTSPVLFTFGVVPPRDKRDGAFHPAGIVFLDEGMPKIVKIGRFAGTLASLSNPATYRRYVKN